MTTYQYHRNGTLPPEEEGWCFVYGSNTRGIHGRGAAKVAKEKYGAILGEGIGFSPNKTAYGIPTKDGSLNVIPFNDIKVSIKKFVELTRTHPELKFFVTAVGCGLAGYNHSQIAVLFKGCSENCSFPNEWKEYLDESLVDRYYTGIGSRESPSVVLNAMAAIGTCLGGKGWILRSGGAEGADTAFEEGCDAVKGKKEIWIPWRFFNKRKSSLFPGPGHYRLAATIHPVWNVLSDGAKSLHARNTAQILGGNLETPSEFVVCYTPDGAESCDDITRKTGGTGTAIKLASMNNIPVFNLANENRYNQLLAYLKTLKQN